MKERIKLILKHKYFKYLILLLIGLFLINESYNIYVDIYNFKQLEKVKIILKDLKISDKQFYNIKEFNKIYKSDIKPIKNCYDIANLKDKTKVPYIFGFKLESYIYRYIYDIKYYAYPKYDYNYTQMCEYPVGCFDASRRVFENIISNPCKEDKE